MLKPILVVAFLCLSVFAQRNSIYNNTPLPVDENLFRSCIDVERVAQQVRPNIPDRVYTVELYSERRGTPVFPFPSDSLPTDATRWMGNRELTPSPFAMFYSVNGGYKFRCRDLQNRFVESTGSGSDPLRLDIVTGATVIWHFNITARHMAHAFVVTDASLERLNGKQLLDEVAQRIGARFLFLYVRNDPWFYGYSSDSTPYLFADSLKPITEEEYRATRTMECSTDQGCRVR